MAKNVEAALIDVALTKAAARAMRRGDTGAAAKALAAMSDGGAYAIQHLRQAHQRRAAGRN